MLQPALELVMKSNISFLLWGIGPMEAEVEIGRSRSKSVLIHGL